LARPKLFTAADQRCLSRSCLPSFMKACALLIPFGFFAFVALKPPEEVAEEPSVCIALESSGIPSIIPFSCFTRILLICFDESLDRS